MRAAESSLGSLVGEPSGQLPRRPVPLANNVAVRGANAGAEAAWLDDDGLLLGTDTGVHTTPAP